MTVGELLNLDMREEGSDLYLQKALVKIKPLSKFNVVEGVPLVKIEKTIMVLSKKYDIMIKDVMPDIWANDKEVIWKAALVSGGNNNQSKFINIYGLSLYEVFAKSAIYMYSVRDKVGERWSK